MELYYFLKNFLVYLSPVDSEKKYREARLSTRRVASPNERC